MTRNELTVTDPREIACVAEIVGCDTDAPADIAELDRDASVDADGHLVVSGDLLALFTDCLPLEADGPHAQKTAAEADAAAAADDDPDSAWEPEERCPARPGDTHCERWWDGEVCCACGAAAMTDEQKREQGMDEEV
jgi:hypothetical protein